MNEDSQYKPKSLKAQGDGLVIEWADGISTFVTFAKLRKSCPCATCNDEREKPANPFRMLTEREVQAGPSKPTQMVPRGRYAYQIVWNDGHDTGIFTLEMLRKLSSE